jgi:glycosyltransferase involved in cell wall biosynthesis
MAHSPKVTVYIPCHDYGEYLDEAIESVVSQEYPIDDLELILIDDGSKDETSEVIESYISDSRIIVIKNDKPKGLVACANMALNAALGKFIIRLDADDYFEPNAIRIMASMMRRHECDVVFSDYSLVDREGSIIGRYIYGMDDFPYHGSCCLIRVKRLCDLGGYPDWLDASDGYWLFESLWGTNNISVVPFPLFNYRKHGKSLSDNEKRIIKARKKIDEMMLKS